MSDPMLNLDVVQQLATLGEVHDEVIETMVRMCAQIPGIQMHLSVNADERITKTVVSMLDAVDPTLRLGAAIWLIDLGRARAQAMAVLFSILRSKIARHRLDAARMLIQLGQTDERVIYTLVSLLDAAESLALDAIQLLVKLGYSKERAVHVLVSLLAAEEYWLRVQAATTLQEIGYADGHLIDPLVSAPSLEEHWGRGEAVALLGTIASEQLEIFETMVERVQPKAWTALAAWQKLRGKDALTGQDGLALADLVAVREHDDAPTRATREALFDALWRMGTKLGIVV
jgi:uncharacterized protein (UPF0335 family)